MVSHLRPAIVLIAVFTLLTGVIFPLGFVGVGQLAMPFQAGGSLIVQNGKVVGSALIGQNFTADKYFHGRPSALMGTDPKDSSKQIATPYDASESGASNLGPTSKALMDRVAGDVKAYHGASVPGDAVTAPRPGWTLIFRPPMRAAGGTCGQGAQPVASFSAGDCRRSHGWSRAWFPRGATRKCPGGQPGAGRAGRERGRAELRASKKVVLF